MARDFVSSSSRWILGLRMSVQELLRQPTYIVTTMLFPSMFFWFFGVPNAETTDSAKLLTGSFCAFAVLGVVLFQLAVQTSQERALNWSFYLRTLPISLFEVLIYRLMASLVLSFAAVGLVVATAFLFTKLGPQDIPWVPFLGTLFLGGLPFLMLGLCLGYLVDGKSIVPVANLIYLPLSFAGGLWMPPNILPGLIKNISKDLPTRWYGDLVWDSLFQREPSLSLWVKLLTLGLLLSGAFTVLYQKARGK